MAFVLNEEIVENLVSQINQDNPAFQFNWKTYAMGTQTQGRQILTNLFVENDDYFALIRINAFDVSSIVKLTLIAKSEIQGVKIHSGILNTALTIRMFNGERHKIHFSPKAGKRLPLHAENVPRYYELFTREFADRTDMKNRRVGLLMRFWNVVVWGVAIIATVTVLWFTQSKFFALLVFVGVAVALESLGGMVKSNGDKQKDKVFIQEIDRLEQTASQLSAAEYYTALAHMTEKPKTEMMQMRYYSLLIQLAHELGRAKEVQEYLKLFPRRYSEETEEAYLSLLNQLATSVDAESEDKVSG